MRYYVIYSLLCAALVIRGSEVPKKPAAKAKRSILTSKIQPINSYDDFTDNENSLANGNPWYPNLRLKMAPGAHDYQLSAESLAKMKRDYELYPLAKELYDLRDQPVSREAKNHDVEFMSPTSAFLGFKAHLHHDVGDIGRSFVHRPTKKDRLSTSIDLENEEDPNSLQFPEDRDLNRLPVQFLDADPDKIKHGPFRRQYPDLALDENYLDKDQLERFLAMSRQPLEFDKNYRRYFNSDRPDHLDDLDKYSKAMDRLGRNSLVLEDVTNPKDGVESEVKTKSLAMAIEPLNGQLQQLVDSVQQINEQLRAQEKREVKGKESRKKRQVSPENKEDCDYSNVETEVNQPLEQSVTCTCYRLEEATPGGASSPLPSAGTSILPVTEGIDSILGGIHTILPTTAAPMSDNPTNCLPIGDVKVEEVMNADGGANWSFRFLRTNEVKLLELLLPAAVVQNVTTEGIIVKVPSRKERFTSLEAGNGDGSLGDSGKERRWGLKRKNRLRNADNKRWSIRLNLPGIEQVKNSVKRKAEEKKDGELLNAYLEMLDKEEKQELEDYEEGKKEKRSLEGEAKEESEGRRVKVGRRLMAAEEENQEEKKLPQGLAVLEVSDITIPHPFDILKQSRAKKNKSEKVKGKLGSIKIPGIHELAKVGKERMKHTSSTYFPDITLGDPMEMLKEEKMKQKAKGGKNSKEKNQGSESLIEHIAKFKIPSPFKIAKVAKARMEKEKEMAKAKEASEGKQKRSLRYKRFGKKDPTDYLLDLTQNGDSDLGDFNLPGVPVVSNLVDDEPSTELYLAYTLPDFDVNKGSDNFDLSSEQTTPMTFPALSMDMPTVSMSTVYSDSELIPETRRPRLKSSILKHDAVETEDSDFPEVTEEAPEHLRTNPAVFETETSILLELEIGLMTAAPTKETAEENLVASSSATETTAAEDFGSTTENDTAGFAECMSASESSTELTSKSTLETNETSATEVEEESSKETSPEAETTTLETISTSPETNSTIEATTQSKCKGSKEELLKQREELEKLIQDLVSKERKLDDEEDEARKLMRIWEDQREKCGLLWDLFFPRPPRPPGRILIKPSAAGTEVTEATEVATSEAEGTTRASTVSAFETEITEETTTAMSEATSGMESTSATESFLGLTPEKSSSATESTSEVEFLSQSTTEFVSSTSTSEESTSTEIQEVSETETSQSTSESEPPSSRTTESTSSFAATESTSATFQKSSMTEAESPLSTGSSLESTPTSTAAESESTTQETSTSESSTESTIADTFLSSITTSGSSASVEESQNLTETTEVTPETTESTTESVSWSTLSWISNITESIWSSLSTDLFSSSSTAENVTETTLSTEEVSETGSGSTASTAAETSTTLEVTTSEGLSSSVSSESTSLEPNISESLASSESTITESSETENSTSETSSGSTSSGETSTTVMSSSVTSSMGSTEGSSATEESSSSTEVASTSNATTSSEQTIESEATSTEITSELSTKVTKSTSKMVSVSSSESSTVESISSGGSTSETSTVTEASESTNATGSSTSEETTTESASTLSELSTETTTESSTTEETEKTRGRFFWFPQTAIATKAPQVEASESSTSESSAVPTSESSTAASTSESSTSESSAVSTSESSTAESSAVSTSESSTAESSAVSISESSTAETSESSTSKTSESSTAETSESSTTEVSKSSPAETTESSEESIGIETTERKSTETTKSSESTATSSSTSEQSTSEQTSGSPTSEITNETGSSSEASTFSSPGEKTETSEKSANKFYWFPKTSIIYSVSTNPDIFSKATSESPASEAFESSTNAITESSEQTGTGSGSSTATTSSRELLETSKSSETVETSLSSPKSTQSSVSASPTSKSTSAPNASTSPGLTPSSSSSASIATSNDSILQMTAPSGSSTTEMLGPEDILEDKLEELEKEVDEREKEVGELETLLENQEEEFEKKTEELEDLIKESTENENSTLSGEDLQASSTPAPAIESEDAQYVYDPEEEVWREKLDIVDPEYNQTAMEYEDCTSTTLNSDVRSTDSPVVRKERKLLAVTPPGFPTESKRSELEDQPVKLTVPPLMLKENEWVNQDSDSPEPIVPEDFQGYTRVYQRWYKVPRKTYTTRKQATRESYQEMNKMISDFVDNESLGLETGPTQPTVSEERSLNYRREKRDDDYYGDCDEDYYNDDDYEPEPTNTQRSRKSWKHDSNTSLKKAEIAMLENENDELIKKEQLLKQIQDALQISKHELRRVESSIVGNGIRRRVKRGVVSNKTASSSAAVKTSTSSLVPENSSASNVSNSFYTSEFSSTSNASATSSVSGLANSSTTSVLTSMDLSSTQATPANSTESYVTRKSSYTVRVVHLVYDDDLEGHRVKLVTPSPEDLVVDEGLDTEETSEGTLSTTESTTDTTEGSTTSTTLCPPCGQTASMPWPTESPDKYHIGGTQSWHKEVPAPRVPVRVKKRRSDRFVDNLRRKLERQLEKSVPSGKKSWTFHFGPESSDDRDLLKKTMEELNIPTETSTELPVDALKRCLEASKSYKAGKLSYRSAGNDSFSIWKLSDPELEESKELMSPSEFYCVYKYGFSENGDNLPRRHLLAVDHGRKSKKSVGKSKKIPKCRVSKQQNKQKLKKSVGKKKKHPSERSQKSAKRSIFDNIKNAFNHLIGNDATTSRPVRIAKESFKPKIIQTKVPPRSYEKQSGKNPKRRVLFRKSVGKKHRQKHKRPQYLYRNYRVKLHPQGRSFRRVRELDEPEVSPDSNDNKKVHAGVPNTPDSNRLGVTEKILIYVTKIKDSRNSSKSKRHRKSALSNLDFEDLYKDKNLNRLISSFADKVVKSLEGSSRSLRELDPRLRVKVLKGSSVSRNPDSDSEFTIDLSDMNADTGAQYLKRSSKNFIRRLVGKSARKMNLDGNFGKKRQNWIREIKRDEIVRKLRNKLLSELEKRMESSKVKDEKKNAEFDSLGLDETASRIDKLGEKFKIMYSMHNRLRRVSTNVRRKRNDAASLLEGVYFDNEKDKKLMRALIDQIFDVQRGVNTTLQIIRRRLATPSDFERDRRLAKKVPKKVKKKKAWKKRKDKKSVGHKKKLKSSYDEGHMDELRNDIEQILKEEKKRKKRNPEGFQKRKILSVADNYDEDDTRTEETEVKIKIKDRQPKEVRKERSSRRRIQRKNIKRNNEAEVSCVNCICDLEAAVRSFQSIVSERQNLLDRVAGFECKKFVDVGEEIELAPSRVIEEIYPVQKSLAQAKGLKFVQLTDLEKVLEAGEGAGRDREILSFPGMDLVIPCDRDGEFNWMISISRPNYTWTRQDDAPVSGTVHKNGNLELNSLTIQDAGNYSCTLTYVDPDNEEVVKHVYKHAVQVVTLPRYSLRGGNRYRVGSCDEDALETLTTYLPQKLNGILCKRHLCDTFIFAPQCSDHQITIKVLVTLSSLSKTVPFLSKCGLRCHKAIQDKLILLLSQNLSAILTKNIVFRLSHGRHETLVPISRARFERRNDRHEVFTRDAGVGLLVGCPAGYGLSSINCVPCSPGFHSKDLSPQCQRCPVGSYQPNLGSRVCRLCTNPFTDGCYGMLWTSPITLGTFSLVIIILLIGLIFCITMSCIRKDKDRDKCLILNPDESRRPLISPRDAEDRSWRKNNYKSRKNQRPFVYGVDVFPRKKKIKIEAENKEILTCNDSDSFDCLECKKLNLQSRGLKKNPRPPVPYPDFDK